MLLFGQETAMMQELVNLATGAGFAGLLWYFVVKHVPAIESRHKSERDEWRLYIKERDEEFNQLTREFLSSLSEIRTDLNALKDHRK